ncbi:hypothetical protein VTH8203_04454 [Vibrio thalassae]|uniref:Uncharacterized protein n=1 Tax=Vibrio thalassae TaxID=1243014 RepID=A0A240ERD6_9VIBR|nr:hypothetical protein [Vibrio thalassae]SNX50780.1 hypothetical protein VTH8203_04454 [Vibrio thalassae]
MNKSVLVVGSIVVVASLFYFGKRSGEELSLPECELAKVAETSVFFFTDDSIDEHRLQCSGQLKLATVLEFFQYSRSDSLGVSPSLY